jgi:hypothetical protein
MADPRYKQVRKERRNSDTPRTLVQIQEDTTNEIERKKQAEEEFKRQQAEAAAAAAAQEAERKRLERERKKERKKVKFPSIQRVRALMKTRNRKQDDALRDIGEERDVNQD